eukprot:gene25021-15656_t
MPSCSYYEAGCRFAKWRSPITIDIATGQSPRGGGPSDLVISANMNDLARYALPDVVLKGDYDLDQAVAINVKVQAALYKAMLDHGSCTTAYSRDDLAIANLHVLRRCFPTAIKGLNYLSGGQPFAEAAARLDAINKAKTPQDPWNLSFSWSTALQNPVLELCRGHGSLQLDAMARLYVEELRIAAAASVGQHTPKQGEGDHVPPTAPTPDAPDRYDSPKHAKQ